MNIWVYAAICLNPLIGPGFCIEPEPPAEVLRNLDFFRNYGLIGLLDLLSREELEEAAPVRPVVSLSTMSVLSSTRTAAPVRASTSAVGGRP
jgi:hypothetical protein